MKFTHEEMDAAVLAYDAEHPSHEDVCSICSEMGHAMYESTRLREVVESHIGLIGPEVEGVVVMSTKEGIFIGLELFRAALKKHLAAVLREDGVNECQSVANKIMEAMR